MSAVSEAGRRGTTLVEVLVALMLGLFLMQLGLATLDRLQRAAERSRRLNDVAVARLVTTSVLRSELGRTSADDYRFAGQDSVVLRVFRGVGVVCPASAGGRTVLVAWSGDREPEPTKDSLEVTTGDGTIVAVDLEGSGPATEPCPLRTGSERVQRWTVFPDLPEDALLIRAFESGSYHLSGAALRYRSGGGGRQPLTPEVWNDRLTSFQSSSTALSVSIVPSTDSARGWEGFLGWRKDR